MKIYVAMAKTESCDTYLFTYDYQPTKKEVIFKVCQLEQEEDLDYYMDTTSVFIETTELIREVNCDCR